MFKLFPDAVAKARAVDKVRKRALKDAASIQREIHAEVPFLGDVCNTQQSMQVTVNEVGEKVHYTFFIEKDKTDWGCTPVQLNAEFDPSRYKAEWSEELKEVYKKTFEAAVFPVDPVFGTVVKEQSEYVPLW